jgi:hypothetical protein
MKKVLTGVLIFFLVIILAAFAIPFFFKDKIIQLAYEQIENYIDAKPEIKSADLSILKNIKNFPNIALSLEGVTLVGKGAFEGDTLLNLGNIKASLDIMSVIKGDEYKIEAVELYDVYLKALVNKDGLQNWDILKPSEDTTEEASSPFKLALNKLILDNVNLYYDDLQSGDVMKIENIEHTGKGDFSTDIFDYISTTNIEKLSVKQGLVKYLSNATLNFDSKVNINQKENKYSFENNKLSLNDLELLFDGFVQLSDDKTNLDVQFKSGKTTFKSILSLIPAIYAKDFDDIKASGNLALDGKIKGYLQGEDYPDFSLNLKVDNGQFQYPDLPTSVNDVFINANVAHAQGDLDKTVIDISKLDFKMGTEPVTAKLKIATPISDPNIDLMAKGKLNLANVSQIYPLEDVEKLSGNVLIDLVVKAKLSDIEAKRYAAISAAGSVSANGIEYKAKDVPPVSVSNLLLNFSPQYVALDNLNANILNSDFDVKGRLENFIGYFLSKDAVLAGNLSVVSKQIDANQFLPDSTSADQSKTEQAKDVVRLPANVDFTANTKVGKLLYDKLVLENLSGNATIKNEQLNLNNLSANLLGGSAIISGFYNTKTDIPTAKLTYNITNFDVQQVYNFVGTVQQAAPIMKHITGSFNSNMNITSNLYPDLSPDLNSLNGAASFKMPWANISGATVINKIAEATKLKQLENIRLENIDLKTTVANGRILVDPFTVKANKMNLTVGGSQGLDQTLDYAVAIDVPWEDLNQEATSFAKNLLAKNPIPQLNNAIPEVIRINLKVTGTATDPKITMGKPDGKIGSGTMKDVVKEQAQQQIQNLKDEANQIKEDVKAQAKQAITNIISGEKSDTAKTTNPVETIKNSGESIKENLQKKLPWKK